MESSFKWFYNNDIVLPYKEIHYKQGDFRKLREKFTNTLRDVTADIGEGNQSGKEGDLSKLYSLVKQIKDEIDDQYEEKVRESANKRKL